MMVSRHDDEHSPLKLFTSTGASAIDGQFDDPVEAPVLRGVPAIGVASQQAAQSSPTVTAQIPPASHQQIPPTTMPLQPGTMFHPGFHAMMAPHGMQPVMIRPAQYVLVPQPMFFPNTPYAPYQHTQTVPQVSTDSETKTTLTNEWHIPMSHNYHPAVGFVPDKQRNSDAAHNLLRLAALHQSKEDIKAPPNPIAESNPMFEDGEPFPVIIEDVEKTFPIEENEINEVDVLCGRGGATNAHPGNVHFRSLVDYYRFQYGTVKKIYKSNIAKTIVKAIRKRHGRFLKKSDTAEVYYEIGDIKAKDKTSQTLREGMAKLVRQSLIGQASKDEEMQNDSEPETKRQKTT